MDVKFGNALGDTELDFLSETQDMSSNSEIRKLMRQFRIQRRLEKIQGGAETDMVKSSSEKQLEESAKILTTLMREGDEIVTNVRVASDSREVDRRDAEWANRQKVIEQVETEAALGQEMFEEITNKWTDVFECNDPIHIHEELELQKDRCNELLRQKDALIESLKDEVKNAEIKFTNDQQKQNEDIRSLGQRIEKQVLMMKNAFKEQLKIIEEVMMVQNKTLLETNNRKWENLYMQTEKEKALQMREALDQMEKYQEEKNEVQLNFQEKHRALKISLSEAIHNLQLMQSTLKANVLLNQEILDYNYQVLRKKENENLMISAHQKRHINKLQDVINGSKKKIHDYNIDSNARIENLTTDVKKLQVRVVEMENKSINLSKVNNHKYNQLWNLNVEDTRKALNKIIIIDKLIHEQQLGLPWQAPKFITTHKHQMPSYCEAKEILRLEAAKSESSALEETILQTAGDTTYNDLLKHILKQIAGKSDFLVEERVQEILKPFLETEKMLVQIDNVFQALRLKKVDDVDLLYRFFHQYAKCYICWTAPVADFETKLRQTLVYESSSTSTSSENILQLAIISPSEMENVIDHALDNLLIERELSEEQSRVTSSTVTQSTASEKNSEQYVAKQMDSLQANRFLCELGHPLSVQPSDVLKALRQFVLFFNSKKNAKISSLSTRLNQQFLTTSRLLAEEDVEIFWQQYRNVFSRSKEQLWDGLLFGLKQYYEILKDRKQMNDEVIGLRKQNAELQRFLHSYTFDKQQTVTRESQRSPV